MAELRDPRETGPHVNRVAGYAVEIYDAWARKKGVPAAEAERNRDTLRMAAILHDVGKVAISDQILKKPGRFTPEEFAIMSTHTYLGARLFLDKQSEFDDMAAEVALMHHENWDGTGYPGRIDIMSGRPLGVDDGGKATGRKGEEISVFGRIVAIADVYDALRSARVYKQAWNEEDVLAEIRKLSGTKFDPEIVDVFFEVLPAILQTAKRYEEKE
jgi:HD-GYP domain-containing protein (c-di-GMP phosphodiesterase class II)